MSFDPKRLDRTVRQGARRQEHLHYEQHRSEGVSLRGRYRPEGQHAKSVGNNTGGDGHLSRKAGRVSWKAGTGEGERKSRATRA